MFNIYLKTCFSDDSDDRPADQILALLFVIIA